jgi:hypothetical protein
LIREPRANKSRDASEPMMSQTLMISSASARDTVLVIVAVSSTEDVKGVAREEVGESCTRALLGTERAWRATLMSGTVVEK